MLCVRASSSISSLGRIPKTFLRNNARPDFAIVAKQLLTEGERDRIETEFLQRHSGHENWHRPAILEDGAEIAPFSFAPKDTEWLQQRSFSRDEVGAIFGVPDEIMGYGRTPTRISRRRSKPSGR